MDKNLYSDFLAHSFLAHHGIKGQKWGVKNGPPYPIQDNKKVALHPVLEGIISVIPGGATLYNAISFTKYGVHEARTKSGLKKDWMEIEGQPEKLSKLKKKDSPSSSYDDIKHCITKGVGSPGNTHNCFNTAVAMEMRARGYDVRGRRLGNNGEGVEVFKALKEMFSGVKKAEYSPNSEKEKSMIDLYRSPDKDRVKAFNDFKVELSKQGNGARGVVAIRWKNGGGHGIFFRVENGVTTIYDGQSKKVVTDKEAKMIMPYYNYYRLDKLKPTQEVTKAVISSDYEKKEN